MSFFYTSAKKQILFCKIPVEIQETVQKIQNARDVKAKGDLTKSFPNVPFCGLNSQLVK